MLSYPRCERMLCRSKTVRQWVTSDHTQGLSWHDTWWWWVFFLPDSDGGSESVFPYWRRLALNLKGGGALYWKGERALCCYRDLKWLTELKCVQQRLAAGFLCHVGSCCSSMKHVSFRVAKFIYKSLKGSGAVHWIYFGGSFNSSEQKDEGKNGESNTLVPFGALYKSEKYPHMLMYQTLQH